MSPENDDSAKTTPRRPTKSSTEILQRVRETLATARLGLGLIKDATDPRNRMSGVRNVVVFGRAVTNVLQNLRSTEPTFDEWYAPHEQRLRNDPLAKFMYDLRTRILKEGESRTSLSLNITGYPEAAMRRFPKPPHAKSFFIGDSIGGSGWIVQLPNGEEEKYYVNLPPDIPGLHLGVHLHFIDAPIEFKDMSVSELCKRYMQMLQDLVADAERRFRKKL